MFKHYSNCQFTGPSGTSWTSIAAIIISLVSIICTLLYLYLGKRVEIVSLKFQKFCIQGLDQILEGLDEKFKQPTLEPNEVKNFVTNVSTDLQLFLITLQRIYPDIKVDQMILLLENFTDEAYRSNAMGNEIKQKYLQTKLLLYAQLYDFALKNELSLYHRLKRWSNGQLLMLRNSR